MAKPRKKVPMPRKQAKSHDELPRHSDWQNPRVVQILDAAGRCFAREGFSNTTVQQIAKEAGLTKSMIHYYFESKQVLILELQAFVHERYFRRVQSKLDALAGSSEARLKEALWEIYDLVKDKQFLRLQLELFAEAGRDPHMHNRMMLAQQRAREFIEEGAEGVVNRNGGPQVAIPKSISFTIASMLLGLRIQEFITGDSETAKQSYELFIAMLTGAMNQGRQTATSPPPAPAQAG
jgi:AcrR family transcriptional regulator